MKPDQSILLVCTKYAQRANDEWMTNTLATALQAQGHRVTVLHVDWTQATPSGVVTLDGRTVMNMRMWKMPRWMPRILVLLGKHAYASLLCPLLVPRFLKRQHYDLMIGFSTALATEGIARYFSRRVARSCIIYWDFFPLHQQQIGVMPGGFIGKAAAWGERTAVSRYTHAGCMSPRNIAFFREYFPEYPGVIGHVPIWGPRGVVAADGREAIRAHYGFKPDEIIAVFGGQLTPGRDIERLCDLADMVAQRLPNLRIVIAGSGSLQPMVEARARASATGNLRYVGQLTREEYTQLLTASDIGLVFTASHVTVPTFPSKTIDYFRTGLPVMAAMEHTTDYTQILQEQIGGGLGGPADDMQQVADNLAALVENAELRRACGVRGQAYYRQHLTVDHAVAALWRLLESDR